MDLSEGKLAAWLLAGEPVYSLEQAEERLGISAELISRLWRGLGFANPPRQGAAFTEYDLHSLEQASIGSAAGLLDEDTIVRLARAIGQTMTRLADWQITLVAARLETIMAERPEGTDPFEVGLELAEVVGVPYEEVLAFAWRRHLGSAIERLMAVANLETAADEVLSTVGFADLVSFSELSNQLSDERIGDLVEVFETRAGDAVQSLGGRVVKTLGDSVLFDCADPVVGIDIAAAIVQVIGGDHRLPDVRIGVATGPVLHRFGDVFGPPVNYAARLTSIARRNRIITDEATAAALPAARYETRALTARPIRGFGLREPIAVRRL
ncbi:MAG: adenylate/guanylate cyclase domain-containing protein [Nocardioidaceae bacterium]